MKHKFTSSVMAVCLTFMALNITAMSADDPDAVPKAAQTGQITLEESPLFSGI